MKRLVASLAMVLTLTMSHPVGAEAKPAYCTVALERCYTACADRYSSDFYRTLCYGGCLIGYADCGS